MAFDVTKPATTDNYLTQFTQGIRANLLALAVGLDSVQSSFTGAVPTYAKRYNRSSKAWEEYNGTSWELLPFGNISAESTITGTTLTSYGVGGGGGLLQLRSPGNGAVGARLEMNADSNLYLVNNQSQGIALGTVGVIRTVIDNTGTLYPQATNSYDLGRASNNWRTVYAQGVRVAEQVSFSSGSGNGRINSNEGTWGMYYRPSVNGTNGCHVWTDAAGNGLMSVSAAGVLNVDTVTAGGTLRLPQAAGQNFFFAGNGDNGTYATHNIKTRLHWGWGLEDSSGTVRGVYDSRTGTWDVKGGYKVDGVALPIYAPVQQGGGGGQSTNKLYIGYGSGQLRLQVDATDFGATWPINISGTAGGTIGLGQSWQDVTGSRAINTAYWNTTGRPIMVSVICDGPDGGPILFIDSVRIASTGNDGGSVGNDHNTVSGIVPNNSHYHVNMLAQNVNQWLELR